MDVAKEILKSKFPNASIGFAAGSFQRGEATTSSDIDLVVVFEKVESAWRESFLFEGWPIEAFVHDPETLNYFFQAVDGKDGVPALPAMVFEGTAIPAPSELSFKLKSRAEKVLKGKPEEWPKETIYHERYGITNLVDDLRDPRNNLEAHIIIASLHESLGDFYFRANGHWSASSKHIPRRMVKLDPQMGKRWIQTFEAAYQGEHLKLINFVEELLMPHGGLLFDTYKRVAPTTWRLPDGE